MVLGRPERLVCLLWWLPGGWFDRISGATAIPFIGCWGKSSLR